MGTIDIILFFVAVIGSIAFGLYKGRAQTKGAQGGASGYFLAGRGLTWWLVGFSLIAANISTEQFVGMTGQSANWLGIAIASYEWIAAVVLVVVGFVFLPRLLRCGIYTVPEFLEYRFGWGSRMVMAVVTMIIIVGVPTASVIYSGAKVVTVFFQGTHVLGVDMGSMMVACWSIGILAAVYVLIGGLKACAWTDLIHGSMLIVGGLLVFALALHAIGKADPSTLILSKVDTSRATVEQLSDAGPIGRLAMLNSGPALPGPNGTGGKFHLVRPASDPFIPWTALLFAIWIPNFFYWGLNQFIVQRTLGSKSLAEGQKGIVFAAFLKLLLPFAVVLPGILAFNLYSTDLRQQAALKNETVIARFTAGAPSVFPFDEGFAKLEPALARRMVEHNAAMAGIALWSAAAEPGATAPGGDAAFGRDKNSVAGENSQVAQSGVAGRSAPSATALQSSSPAPTPAALFAENTRLLAAARARGVPETAMLAGYDYDAAYGTLLRHLLRPGIKWFVLAALFGAVVSALASMLNAAATIFTMDIFRKAAPRASQGTLVTVGRLSTVAFVIISCLIAPNLGSPKFNGIFAFMQEFQGYVGPGVLCVFLFGFLVPRAPRYCGWIGIAFNAVFYEMLILFAPGMAISSRWGASFLATAVLLGAITLARPLSQPVTLPVSNTIALENSRAAKVFGLVVVALTIVIYIIFW